MFFIILVVAIFLGVLAALHIKTIGKILAFVFIYVLLVYWFKT